MIENHLFARATLKQEYIIKYKSKPTRPNGLAGREGLPYE